MEGDWAVSSDYSCERVGPKPTENNYIEQLQAFYRRHNPKKAGRLECEAAMAKWVGREERLFFVLRQKYKVKDEL